MPEARLATQRVDGARAGHRQQPGHRLAQSGIEPRRLAPHLEVGVFHHLLGQRRAAHDAQHQTVGARQRGVVQRGQRSLVARHDAVDPECEAGVVDRGCRVGASGGIRPAARAGAVHRVGTVTCLSVRQAVERIVCRRGNVQAEGGTFLEIGKRDLWSAERVAALGRGIRYHVVDCSERARETPQIVGATFRRVVADIASGALPPLPITTFALADAAAAFRHMAQARHIGRVVLRHPADAPALAAPVRADAVYLVTGGTRGIGLVTARWLVEQGARRLVLASRSAPDAAAQAEIDALRAAGAEVDVVAADLGRDDGVEALMQALHRSGRPLGGVLHGAAALDDGVLLRQDAGRLAAAMAAKADGAWRLDRALRRHGFSPDFFVLHSSMSATLGSPGQGNYVAANAFLDVLARHRRMRGLPATAVAWGAWQAVGMAARGGAAARAGDQGFEALEPAQGVQALERLLETGTAHAAVAPVDWSRVAQLGGGGLPLLRELLGSAEAGRDTADAATPDLAALPADERSGRLGALLRRELSVVLPAGGSALADDTPFTSLGLDSLANVELRNRLQRAIGRPVAATAPFDHPTVGGLVAHLGSLFAADAREELTL